MIVVNLEELGYNKLLGEGSITKPMKILVPRATRTAVEKVKGAGGEVVITSRQTQ